MARFTDADYRPWVLWVDIAAVRRVRQAVPGVDLLAVGPELFAAIDNPESLVDVLHCLLQSQAESQGLDAIGFARAMRGETLDRAKDALLESLLDFFPSRQREILNRLIAADRQVTAAALKKLDRLGAELAQSLDSVSTFGAVSTSGPESSDLIPDPIPSES